MKIIMHLFILTLLALFACSCKDCSRYAKMTTTDKQARYVRPDCNSVYYWKTRFALNEYEKGFLKQYQVGRIYLHFFDVDAGDYVEDRYPYALVPIGTVTFDSRKPEDVEIVPTVYLTCRAMTTLAAKQGEIGPLAEKLVTRILNMADYNDLGPIHEIQLDCDWTQRTRETFYRFCDSVKVRLAPKRILLSATIRLHQLGQAAPPVDRGVLMLYNTGAFSREETQNSILDEKDATQYLKKPIQYAIPLDYAWPTYSLGILFRNGTFLALLHQTDYPEGDLYSVEGDSWMDVLQEHVLENHLLKPGDRIRLESVPFSTMSKVASAVNRALPDMSHRNILYHLDSTNLSHYLSDEIQTAFAF